MKRVNEEEFKPKPGSLQMFALACDAPRCTTRYEEFSRDPQQHRVKARMMGWVTHDVAFGVDLCPSHRSLFQTPKTDGPQRKTPLSEER